MYTHHLSVVKKKKEYDVRFTKATKNIYTYYVQNIVLGLVEETKLRQGPFF